MLHAKQRNELADGFVFFHPGIEQIDAFSRGTQEVRKALSKVGRHQYGKEGPVIPRVGPEQVLHTANEKRIVFVEDFPRQRRGSCKRFNGGSGGANHARLPINAARMEKPSRSR